MRSLSLRGDLPLPVNAVRLVAVEPVLVNQPAVDFILVEAGCYLDRTTVALVVVRIAHGNHLRELPARMVSVRPHYRPDPPNDQEKFILFTQISSASIGPTGRSEGVRPGKGIRWHSDSPESRVSPFPPLRQGRDMLPGGGAGPERVVRVQSNTRRCVQPTHFT